MCDAAFGVRRVFTIPMLLSAVAIFGCGQSREHSDGILRVDAPGFGRAGASLGSGELDTVRDPLDAAAGDYSGSVTLGDSRDGGLIPGEFLMSIDLGLKVRKDGSNWSGELSFKRFVTTNATHVTPPDCQNVAARELKAPLQSISIQTNGAFQATSAPILFCVRSDKAIERRVQLRGTLVTRRNCAHVEVRGSSYGDYQETVRGLITLPTGNEMTLSGTYLLTKIKESPDAGLPNLGDQCPDLNPDP